jgi:hypothetical protein
MRWIATGAMSVSILMLGGCSDGRWMHQTKTEVQAQQDWDLCKAEVLSGQEHRKDTMAGGINLSGCMQSKGYTYVEGQAAPPSSADGSITR